MRMPRCSLVRRVREIASSIPTRGDRTGEGFGAGVCIGCHGRFGIDYVVLEYPLE